MWGTFISNYCPPLLQLPSDKKGFFKEFTVRLNGWFLGSCHGCAACEAGGSTIEFQRTLCINQVNSGRAFPVVGDKSMSLET